MNTSNNGETNGACGMCALCNSMPPWAPERVATLSPVERAALDARMAEAQRRFIASRVPPIDSTVPKLQPPVRRDLSRERQDEDGDQDEQGQEQLDKPDATHGSKSIASPNVSQSLQVPSLSAGSLFDLESDADSYHTADSYSPLHVAPVEDLDNLPTSLSPDEISTTTNRAAIVTEPVDLETSSSYKHRGITVSNERPSFDAHPPLHSSLFSTGPTGGDTINGFKETSGLPGKSDTSVPRENHNPSTTVIDMHPLRPPVYPKSSDQILSEEGANCTAESADLSNDDIFDVLTINGVDEPHDAEQKHSLIQVDLNDSSNLSAISACPSHQQSPVSNGLPQTSQLQELQYKSETFRGKDQTAMLIPTNVKTQVPSNDAVQCPDCLLWRHRVQELEAKVEALYAVIAARDMDSAYLRARLGDGGFNVARNEARLVQECQSLRMTAEFLVRYSFLFHFRYFLHLSFIPFTCSLTDWIDIFYCLWPCGSTRSWKAMKSNKQTRDDCVHRPLRFVYHE